MVTIVIERTEESIEVLFAISVEVAVIEYLPSSRSESNVKEKLPLLSASAVPISTSSLKIVTIEFSSAVPEIVGVESFKSEIWVKDVGVSGAVVSIVMEREEDSEEVLLAESVALAVKV